MNDPNAGVASPQGLIAELDAADREHEHASIAVANGESEAVTISAHRPDRLQALIWAIAEGGVPLGLILLDRVDGRLVAVTRLYPNCAATFAAVAVPHLDRPTPTSIMEIRAQEFLDGVAEGVVYEMDWDSPYKQAIDRAIAEAGRREFLYPLEIEVHVLDGPSDEMKSFTLQDFTYTGPEPGSEEEECPVLMRNGHRVTDRVNFEIDAPRFPARSIVVYGAGRVGITIDPSVGPIDEATLATLHSLSRQMFALSPRDWG